MNNQWLTTSYSTNQKTGYILLLGITHLVSVVVAQDFLRATIQGSAFYVSESLLFSVFWWMFAPLLLAQYALVKHTIARQFCFQGLAIVVPIVVHLIMFPVLVWVLSSTFYYHTFAIPQTMRYALAEHVYQVVVVYATPVLVYPYYLKIAKAAHNPLVVAPIDRPNPVIQALLVSDGVRKRTIPLQQIVYFSALPPYIGIHTDQKKYIYSETLKSIATRLPPQQFVRIHKSTIVNVNQVASYRSRLNGDYDLILTNKATLRVSRNFAAEFKQRYQESHQLTPE